MLAKRMPSCSGSFNGCPPFVSGTRPSVYSPRLPEVPMLGQLSRTAIAGFLAASLVSTPLLQAQQSAPPQPAAAATSAPSGPSDPWPRRLQAKAGHVSHLPAAARHLEEQPDRGACRRSRSSRPGPRIRLSASSGSRRARTSTRPTASCISKTSPSRARASRRRRKRPRPGSRRSTSSSRRSARRPSRSTGSRRTSVSSRRRRRANRARWTTPLRRSSSRTSPLSSC